MKFSTLTIALFFVSAVQAASPTPFDVVLEKAKGAEPTKLSDLTDWLSGRCFEANQKSKALPGLLAVVPADAGPLLPGELIYIGMDVSFTTLPTAFDTLDSLKEKIDLVARIIPNLPSRYAPAQETPTGVVFGEYFGGSVKVAIEHRLKKSGSMIFSVQTAKEGLDLPSAWTGDRKSFNKGETLRVCYFFKSIITRTELETLR